TPLGSKIALIRAWLGRRGTPSLPGGLDAAGTGRAANLGQMGMPAANGITGGGSLSALPRQGGLCAALASAVCAVVAAAPAHAEAARQAFALDAYIAAVLQLDRHELAALALTLGILCFAVVTSVLLVRARRRLSETEIAA